MVRLARFRLRFLLQEIDLPPGESILGRSASCHITIEDPLVSRRHARIQVTGDRATIEDLGSRNGLFVGGQLARGVVDVSAGARVRVGTQELVICRSAEENQTKEDQGLRHELRLLERGSSGICPRPWRNTSTRS